MTKIIGIVTLYGDMNFGNKLQNYASQKYFENMGYTVWTFPNMNHVFTSRDPILFAKKIAHKVLQFIGQEQEVVKKQKKDDIRSAYIRTFSDQYIHLFPAQKDIKSSRRIQKKFDYFVTGSDQVWHYSGKSRRLIKYYLLYFAKPEQRLTIAPSFSFFTLPKKYEKIYKKGLEGFSQISVREERGAELIKELTGKDAVVLVDPTMLINTEEWIRIIKKPCQYENNSYLLVYALSGLKAEVQEIITNFAHSIGTVIVDLMDDNSDYYIHTRPDEFLYWIYHAKMVITDSFHATVFSILFGRPFVVTERTDIKGMGSRIDTLLSKFGLQGRRLEVLESAFQSVKLDEIDVLFQTNYEYVPQVLKVERQRAAEFYAGCLHTAVENLLQIDQA